MCMTARIFISEILIFKINYKILNVEYDEKGVNAESSSISVKISDTESSSTQDSKLARDGASQEK